MGGDRPRGGQLQLRAHPQPRAARDEAFRSRQGERLRPRRGAGGPRRPRRWSGRARRGHPGGSRADTRPHRRGARARHGRPPAGTGHNCRGHRLQPRGLEPRAGRGPRQFRPGGALIDESRGMRLAGTWTHFASSESDDAMTRRQFEIFLDAVSRFEVGPGMRHACNSAGALNHPDFALDAVRCGISIYGCEWPGTRPALALRATVTHLKTVEKGATVGYGALWKAPGQARVATVAIGYADGVHRARANRGHVLVRGHRAPLIGMVSMDAITLDVSDVPGVQVGDTATLIGRDRDQVITAEEVAEWSGTISYEVLTSIGQRVERRHLPNPSRQA
ncbi:MAG: alanine racemase [Chloroflexi bacterium]|nr:MAG: alanine racemase [Chloroflexota bacterium]